MCAGAPSSQVELAVSKLNKRLKTFGMKVIDPRSWSTGPRSGLFTRGMTAAKYAPHWCAVLEPAVLSNDTTASRDLFCIGIAAIFWELGKYFAHAGVNKCLSKPVALRIVGHCSRRSTLVLCTNPPLVSGVCVSGGGIIHTGRVHFPVRVSPGVAGLGGK